MAPTGTSTTDDWERLELDAARAERVEDDGGGARTIVYYAAVGCWIGFAATTAGFGLHTLFGGLAGALTATAVAWSILVRARAPRSTPFMEVVRARPGDVRWAYVVRREVRGYRARMVTHRMSLHLADGALITSAGWDVLSPNAITPVFARLPNARVGDTPAHRAAYEQERAAPR